MLRSASHYGSISILLLCSLFICPLLVFSLLFYISLICSLKTHKICVLWHNLWANFTNLSSEKAASDTSESLNSCKKSINWTYVSTKYVIKLLAALANYLTFTWNAADFIALATGIAGRNYQTSSYSTHVQKDMPAHRHNVTIMYFWQAYFEKK